jgi:hypothetical protein
LRRERERERERERKKKTAWSGALTLTKGLLDIIPIFSVLIIENLGRA